MRLFLKVLPSAGESHSAGSVKRLRLDISACSAVGCSGEGLVIPASSDGYVEPIDQPKFIQLRWTEHELSP